MSTAYEQRQQWLASIKPGDEVYDGRGIVKVARCTATQIIVTNGRYETRYRRSDGDMVGRDQWATGCIQELTPTLRNKVEKAALLARFRQASSKVSVDTFTLDKLRRLVEMLEEVQK